MKKLFIILTAIAMVGAFTATTMAADWGFYGSSRMATFYESTSKEATGTDDSYSTLSWLQQGNSRIGANVKVSDAFSGRFEYGFSGDNVSGRILWGEYNFGGWSLGLGQHYTPVAWWVGAQVFDSDTGLIGYGAPYGGRKDQIKFKWQGLQIAAIENTQDGSDETMIPKLEAQWAMPLGSFALGLYGGYQTYKDTPADETVNSIMYGLGFNGNFGAFWFNSAVSGGSNIANAGWANSNSGPDAAGGKDTQTVAVALALGMSASDSMSFEGGLGYTADTNDDVGPDTDTNMSYYLNMTWTIAPGFFIVPEVGIVDYMKDMNDLDEGALTYAGAKWQMNF